VKKLVEYARNTCTERREVLPLKRINTANNWYLLLPWLHALNIQNQSHAKDHEDDSIEQAKIFTLAPICSLEAGHITIDNAVLYGLLKRSEEKSFNFTSLKKFRESNKVDEWWRKVFDLTKFEKKEKEGGEEVRKFKNFVKTDGVSVSFSFSVPKSKEDLEDPDAVADMVANGIKDKKKRQYKTPLKEWSPFEQFPEIDKLTVEDTEEFLKLLEDFLIIGVDPGRRDIVTANYASPSSSSNRKRTASMLQIASKALRGSEKRKTDEEVQKGQGQAQTPPRRV